MIDGLRLGDATRPLVELGGRFRFNTTLFDLLVDGWKASDWRHREGGANPAFWVLGHLVVMRYRLLRTLGVKTPERAWEELFMEGPSSFGGAGASERFEALYPRHDELVSCFRSSDRPLVQALCEISQGEARTHCAADVDGADVDPADVESADVESAPGARVTLGSCAGFFYFDEAYHLGQLGLMRQELGKPRVP